MVLWPFVAYIVAVVVLVAAMLGVSYLLGQRHRERATGVPYEGGIVSDGLGACASLRQILPGGDVLRDF